MTTPAAWVEAWRHSPSSRLEMSMSLATRSSSRISWDSSGSRSRALAMVIFRSSEGMSLAIRSVSAKVMPRARPTSLMTALAFIVPKVVICATESSP